MWCKKLERTRIKQLESLDDEEIDLKLRKMKKASVKLQLLKEGVTQVTTILVEVIYFLIFLQEIN